jgi:hypothetical protein
MGATSPLARTGFETGFGVGFVRVAAAGGGGGGGGAATTNAIMSGTSGNFSLAYSSGTAARAPIATTWVTIDRNRGTVSRCGTRRRSPVIKSNMTCLLSLACRSLKKRAAPLEPAWQAESHPREYNKRKDLTDTVPRPLLAAGVSFPLYPPIKASHRLLQSAAHLASLTRPGAYRARQRKRCDARRPRRRVAGRKRVFQRGIHYRRFVGSANLTGINFRVHVSPPLSIRTKASVEPRICAFLLRHFSSRRSRRFHSGVPLSK